MTESTSQPAQEVTVTPDNATAETAVSDEIQEIRETIAAAKPEDSYVKLAMRNMVRKGRQSLWHFFLTTVGLVGLLVGLAYLTKP
ncbi:MAG: DUF3285 domain-containing protein [Cyanobacteria bacterium J06621_12]